MTQRRRRKTATATSWSGQRRSFPTKLRERILRRDPICRACGVNPSTIADHIKPHAECVRDGQDPDTITNGQGLCEDCHAAKTQEERERGQQRRRRQRPPEPHPGLIR